MTPVAFSKDDIGRFPEDLTHLAEEMSKEPPLSSKEDEAQLARLSHTVGLKPWSKTFSLKQDRTINIFEFADINIFEARMWLVADSTGTLFVVFVTGNNFSPSFPRRYENLKFEPTSIILKPMFDPELGIKIT